MTELTEIFAYHLTTLVFIYGSVGLLLANLMGMLALGRFERSGDARARAVLARAS